MIATGALHPPTRSPRTEGENADHAQVLADSGGVLPPITVHRATMRVVDGMHRLRAATLRGEIDIPVRFYEGPEEDAFVFGVAENTTHGRPLSASDRSAAASRILLSHPQWSDRVIAGVAGISTKAVSSIRRQSAELPQPEARVGRDGRVRPVDGALGRLRASELITSKPEASLREVAKEAGVSPGTVRDVRDRLRRGENPVPAKQRPQPVPAHPAAASPPATNVTSAHPRVERRAPAPVMDRTRILSSLVKDPSLRYSVDGRTLLRLLATHMIPGRQRDALALAVPQHCAGTVSAAARECAAAWVQLAEHLENSTRTADR
jgi:ParB-like chromosome segregation protein Spo0J